MVKNMKSAVLLVHIAVLITLTSARPTFDKIAEVLLEALDGNSYSRYPAGSANYPQSYHQHHHDHYYGNGIQSGDYYQQPTGGYPDVQPNYYPHAQKPYPQRPYVNQAQGNYGGYANPASGFAISLSARDQPTGYPYSQYYKQHGY